MSGRTKIPVAMRLAPDVKAEADRRAREERRSFTSYIEWIVLQDALKHPAQRQEASQKPRP